jgi:AAA ATPase domain
MKLNRVDIHGYASIKKTLSLHLDGRITTLIGANDTGKTNLLKAIRCLNDDVQFSSGDRNWDLTEETTPSIEWSFTLDPEDRTNLAVALEAVLTQQSREAVVRHVPEVRGLEITEVVEGNVQNTLLRIVHLDKVVMHRAIDFSLSVKESVEDPDLSPPINAALLKLRPRVELFAPAEQLMDVITLEELEQPDQEFMQGIFRYAGIWEERKSLFRQTPGTEHQLVRASEAFTQNIRKEWQQGEGLSFRLSHTGQNGDHIQLYIGDPAVGGRFVRPSERSEGFSAFFKMDMRLRARTAASAASSYIFLFDEPGTLLHPSGQVDLLRVFERLSDENQIIYSTHSLFMINHNRPLRNRVVSKGSAGTQIDQKPFLKNWRAVRASLGLILAGTFFIAERTLLVEGESDAMYIPAMLGAFDRAGVVDVDLNLFSVQWAGNERDFAPMARLLLEEGREVVAVVDGDEGGTKLKRSIDRLNAEITRNQSGLSPVAVIELPPVILSRIFCHNPSSISVLLREPKRS